MIRRAYEALGIRAGPLPALAARARAASTSPTPEHVAAGRPPCCAEVLDALRPALRGGRGRGRVLRPEDRRPGRRRRRPGVHPVHRPGRLPPARAVRPALHRRRTAPSTGRSWSTAASSAAWSGPSPTSSSSTAAPFPPGSPRPSWSSCRSPRPSCRTPTALGRRCADRGLRAEVAGPERGTLGARIRAARLVPYQAVIGAREAADDQVALRLRDGRRLDAAARRARSSTRIGALVAAHSTELWETEVLV